MIGNVYLKKEGLNLANELRIIIGDASSYYKKPDQYYVLLVERLFNDHLHKADEYGILADAINVRSKKSIEERYDFSNHIKEDTLNKIKEISVDLIKMHDEKYSMYMNCSFETLKDMERKLILELFKILKEDSDFHFEFLLK